MAPQIGRVLRESIVTTASLPKLLQALEHAASELAKADRLRKPDDAAVAEAGGDGKKAAKLRAQAGVVLAPDWSQYFPDEAVPVSGLRLRYEANRRLRLGEEPIAGPPARAPSLEVDSL